MAYSEVLVGGFRFKVRSSRDVYVLNEVAGRNCYQIPDDLKDKTVIDIGGNIGSFAILAAARGAKVYTFEPFEESFDMLCTNVNANGLNDSIIAMRLGIGNPGWRPLYVHPTDHGSHSIVIGPHTQSVMIRTEPLLWMMKLFSIEHCNLLKIDCEGGEVEIFEELLLSKQFPMRFSRIVTEAHPYMTPIVDKLKEQLERLKNKAKLYQGLGNDLHDFTF